MTLKEKIKNFSEKIYKNTEHIDIWTGSKLTTDLIDRYIIEFLKVVKLKDNTKFFPYGEIKYTRFINLYFNTILADFNLTLTSESDNDWGNIGRKRDDVVKYNFNSSIITVNSSDSYTVQIIIEYLSQMLTSDFNTLFLSCLKQFKGFSQSNPNIEINLSKTLIQFISSQANPDYIKSLIDNDPEFYLTLGTIEKIKDVKSYFLSSFNVNLVNKNSISINPIFIIKKVELTKVQIDACYTKMENESNYAKGEVERLNRHHYTEEEFSETWSDGSCVCCDQSPCICYD